MAPDAVNSDGSVMDGSELTDDAFLGGRLSILQPRKGFRAGLDSVLLAAAVPINSAKSEAVFEAGCGCGVVGLAVLTRAGAARLIGLEIDPELVALSHENARRNGLADRTRFVLGDVRDGQTGLETANLDANSFDHVIANPPFYSGDSVQHAPNPQKDRANAMAPEDLDRWVRFLTTLARSRGTLTMIHRAEALPELLKLLAPRFGSMLVLPVHPREGTPASRVLVQGRRNSRQPMTLLPGFILHDVNGAFTPQAERILRHGEALRLGLPAPC